MVKYKSSVIIPVYNTEQYLEECIQSVLNQTQKDIEVILVDDGSTDNSYEIMLSYKRQYCNVKVFHQENRKQGAARNCGIENANGQYVFFLDSDDYIKPNCLEALYYYAEKNRLDFITYDADIMSEDIVVKKNYASYDRSKIGIERDRIYSGLEFLNSFFVCGGAYVSACLSYYNIDFLKKNQISFEEQVYYEDNGYALEVYCNARRMMYLPEKLYVRRYRANSTMTSECGIVHLQSALKMNVKCLQMLMQIADSTENIEGIRGIVAELANRLAFQMESYKNELDLQKNAYICDLCSFFLMCDAKRLLSYIGLELTYNYYYILSMIIEKGYLRALPDLKREIHTFVTMLKTRIKKVIDSLFSSLHILEDNGGKIVIYGTGDIAERIIKCCKIIYGNTLNLDNKIIFANTETPHQKRYLDLYPLVSISSVQCFPVAAIIVASTKYEFEMCSILDQLFGKKYVYLTYREIANRSMKIEM